MYVHPKPKVSPQSPVRRSTPNRRPGPRRPGTRPGLPKHPGARRAARQATMQLAARGLPSYVAAATVGRYASVALAIAAMGYAYYSYETTETDTSAKPLYWTHPRYQLNYTCPDRGPNQVYDLNNVSSCGSVPGVMNAWPPPGNQNSLHVRAHAIRTVSTPVLRHSEHYSRITSGTTGDWLPEYPSVTVPRTSPLPYSLPVFPTFVPVNVPYPRVSPRRALRPRLRPYEVPATDVNIRPGQSPGTRPRPVPGVHVRMPPRFPDKEKKGIADLGLAGKAYGFATEVGDALDCMENSMGVNRPRPKSNRITDRIANIYANFDLIDAQAAIECMAVQNIQDEVVGRLSKVKPMTNRPFSLNAGSWARGLR